MSSASGHRIRPVDQWLWEKDNDALAGIKTVILRVPCPDISTCNLTLRRREIGGWSEERLAEDDHGHTTWVDGPPAPEWTYCSRRCPRGRMLTVSYEYVTGRAGRRSLSEKHVCEEHAQKFCAKYDLDVPGQTRTQTG